MPSRGKKKAVIPEHFRTIVTEFVRELEVVYPEHQDQWNLYNTPESMSSNIRGLYDHMVAMFPERFFDILYQNEEIFAEGSEINTHFFPNVEFRVLYHAPNVSDQTRQAIWKYLLLLLSALMTSIKDASQFGEAQSLFEGMDEKALEEKLAETFKTMSAFFEETKSAAGTTATENEDAGATEGEPHPFTKLFGEGGIPNAEGIHEHLKTLFDSKLGRLAKDLAEELSGEFGDMMGTNVEGMTTEQAMKNLFKNPSQMMNMVKKVSSKLDEKMKRGDISQEEIMKEAGDLFSQMKNNPQFGELLKNMSKQMGGKGAKLDMNALGRLEKQHNQRERMRRNIEKKRAPARDPRAQVTTDPDRPDTQVFHLGDEKQDKSARPTAITATTEEKKEEIEAWLSYIEKEATKPKNNKTSKK